MSTTSAPQSKESRPLYTHSRLGYVFARAVAAFLDFVVAYCFYVVLRLVLDLTGIVHIQQVTDQFGDATWWASDVAVTSYAQVTVFLWRWWAGATGRNTFGRKWMYLDVTFPEGQSRVPIVWRSFLHSCWWLVPSACLFIYAGGYDPWQENPFDLLLIVMLLMVMFSPTGAHLFDWLAKSRVELTR